MTSRFLDGTSDEIVEPTSNPEAVVLRTRINALEARLREYAQHCAMLEVQVETLVSLSQYRNEIEQLGDDD